QSFTSYYTKYKTYEKTTSIEEKSTYKENLISYEKTKYDSTKFIISYETKINTIYITKTIKTIGNKEIITTYPIITTIYESPSITTTTSNTITSYKQESTSSILTTIPKKITTIYEEASTIKNTEEPITTYKQITTTITSSSLTSSTSTSIKTTSTSYKQTTAISTSSSKITTSSTTYSFKTETIYYTITGFTTTYKTALYTYTTTIKKTTSSSSQISGGGGGGREGPLLRDSILSNKNVYKEFLDKIKKIEENKNNIKHQYIPSYQILKYLVFKIVPIRINIDNNLEDSKIYKINIVINNYDNIDREFIIKIEDIKGRTNGLFLIKPIVNNEETILCLKTNEEIEIKEEIDFSIKANYLEKIEKQFFFLPIIGPEGCETVYQTSINYKKYRISIYTDSKRIYEKEITVWPSSFLTPFWKGFYRALSDNWPSLALSTIALILIGVASGGAGTIAEIANAALFIMFLSSVGMNIMQLYYAYAGYDYFNKKIEERYNEISNKYGIDAMNFIKEIENDDIEKIKKDYVMNEISDFFLSFEITDLLKATGIIEVSEEEKGYAAGKIFVAAYSFTTFSVGYVIKGKISNVANKGGISYVKDLLSAWMSAPLVDAIVIAYKYKQIKWINDLREKGITISEEIISKIKDRFAKDLEEIINKNNEIKMKIENIENYALDTDAWSELSYSFKNYIEGNNKINEDISNVNDFINRVSILEKYSELFWGGVLLTKNIYGEIKKDKVIKILTIFEEAIKENGIDDAENFAKLINSNSELLIKFKNIIDNVNVENIRDLFNSIFKIKNKAKFDIENVKSLFNIIEASYKNWNLEITKEILKKIESLADYTIKDGKNIEPLRNNILKVFENIVKYKDIDPINDIIIGPERYYTSDYRVHIPSEVAEPEKFEYLIAGDKCIWIEVVSDDSNYAYIPVPAAEYLVESGYHPDPKILEAYGTNIRGFVIISKKMPEGTKLIMPIKIEANYKISVTFWLRRLIERKFPNSNFIIGKDVNFKALSDADIVLKIKVGNDIEYHGFSPKQREASYKTNFGEPRKFIEAEMDLITRDIAIEEILKGILGEGYEHLKELLKRSGNIGKLKIYGLAAGFSKGDLTYITLLIDQGKVEEAKDFLRMKGYKNVDDLQTVSQLRNFLMSNVIGPMAEIDIGKIAAKNLKDKFKEIVKGFQMELGYVYEKIENGKRVKREGGVIADYVFGKDVIDVKYWSDETVKNKWVSKDFAKEAHIDKYMLIAEDNKMDNIVLVFYEKSNFIDNLRNAIKNKNSIERKELKEMIKANSDIQEYFEDIKKDLKQKYGNIDNWLDYWIDKIIILNGCYEFETKYLSKF
ncbi:MAG: hypothetical protein QXN52_09945, partial [Nitrososphaerota archaeon]